jgi:carboxymethylenebutenolidase
MMLVAPSQPGEEGFLKFNSAPLHVFLTDKSPHSSERLFLAWNDEGFDATYLPYNPPRKPLVVVLLSSLAIHSSSVRSMQ